MKFAKTINLTDIKDLITTKELFIFDLDGTLFNTLGDLAPAVNFAMHQYGLLEHSNDVIQTFIGNGSLNLIRRAVACSLGIYNGSKADKSSKKNKFYSADKLNATDVNNSVLELAGYNEEKIKEIHNVYSIYYKEHCTENTIPYEGVVEFIDWIYDNKQATNKNIAAMLTNKPVEPSKKILKKFRFIQNSTNFINNNTTDKIKFYLCGDTTPERKPSPAGIFKILKDTGVSPEKSIMIGDDMPDIMAAKNANIDCITLLKGFGKIENLLSLQPKYTIPHIKDLIIHL